MFLYSTVSTLKPGGNGKRYQKANRCCSEQCGADKGGWYHTDGGDGGDDFTELELVEDGGFTGGVESDHQNAHLLLPPQLIKDLGESETHGCGLGDGAL